mmetsp:Transcript_10861/g.27142  ORF Transcript_10861/g.27142 Transcript_10861/m.27142 type:complete len:226 (-) Transcript_10861:243-920(-)
MDAAISDSPKSRSKSGFSKTLLKKGMSLRPAPKRSHEEPRASDTTKALSGSGAGPGLAASSWPAAAPSAAVPVALSVAAAAACAAASSSAAALAAAAALIAWRPSFHCLVFSAFLSASLTQEKTFEEESITFPKTSFVLPNTALEDSLADSDRAFMNSLAFFKDSFCSEASFILSDAADMLPVALSFQRLSTSEVDIEALLNLSPNSLILSSTVAPRSAILFDCC